jgi:hypothetical protein
MKALAPIVIALLAGRAAAQDWHVAAGAAGDGSAGAPFGTIQQGLAAAMPGDVVVVAPGTYGAIETQRDGMAGAPITIRGEAGVIVSAAGRVLTVSHAFHVFEQLAFDAQYADADAVRIETAGEATVLRRCEVRRAQRDCVDLGAPAGVVIEGCTIHHCLNATGGRTDAHGIVGANVRDLVIRDTEIHTFSGDAVQFDPGRATPAWDNVTIEGCTFWLEPLPAPENGFAAGVVPGENAVDTKVPAGESSRLNIRNTTTYGFRGGLIGNMAAFNLKEGVVAQLDRITIRDSEIGLRLRGPASVAVANAVIFDVDAAVRYEDEIVAPKLYSSTIGGRVANAFVEASSSTTQIDGKNVLVLGPALPAELAANGGSLAVAESAFVDAAGDDYHLVAGSPAVDRGIAVEVATDRDGNARPHGVAHDIGAYERCEPDCVATDGGVDGGGDDDGSPGGGCCEAGGSAPLAPALFVIVIGCLGRRSRARPST